ncbi:MAG: hypothetical protein ACTSRP_05080 [Candidatus Helarchaeota archaeon]
MGKYQIFNEIIDAMDGLPETILFYLDREIDNEHIYAPDEYKGKRLSKLISDDITYISSFRKSRIRAIVGRVGSGKTVLLSKFRDSFLNYFQNSGMILYLNLSDISITNPVDFASEISKKIYFQIKEYFDILGFDNLTANELLEIFDDFNIVKAINNIKINEYEAKNFFYNKITEGNLISLLEGYLSSAFNKNYPVLFLIDELNYLIKNDPNENKILTNIIVQRLLRGWWEKFNNKPLLLMVASLEKEFNDLQNINPSFYSIIDRNIIKLEKFSKKEKRELMEAIYKKYNEFLSPNISLNNFIDEIERRIQNSKDKTKLDYYFQDYARGFVQIVATVMYDNIDINFYQKSYELYEEDARAFIKPILSKKGFDINSMPNKPFKYDGFEIDVYAENKKHRQGIIHALGECKSTKFNSKYVDEWDYKLLKLKEKGSYNKNLDFIFTIAPDYTSEAENRLRAIGCEIYRFESERAKNLISSYHKTKDKKIKKHIEKKPKIRVQKSISDKKLKLDDLTRAQGEFLEFINKKGGKVGIVTLKKNFGNDKALRLIKELENLGKIKKEKRSYKLV